jgi:hypothetical protein
MGRQGEANHLLKLVDNHSGKSSLADGYGGWNWEIDPPELV